MTLKVTENQYGRLS